MQYFETIRLVLDRTLSVVCRRRNLCPDTARELLVSHLKTMSQEWYSGGQPQIDYEDPFCRLAYLYCHVAANANLFEVSIRRTPELREYVKQKLSLDGLRVCGLGGGPGTELLGLAKYVSRIPETGNILSADFTVFDKVQEWADSWSALQQVVTTSRCVGNRSCPRLVVSRNFCCLDITQLDRFANIDILLQHDLYVLNYVVSEQIQNLAGLSEVVAHMIRCAPVEAKFVVIDRHQSEVLASARALLDGHGVAVEDEVPSCAYMDFDEQRAQLEPYCTLVGRSPRVKWDAFWLIASKQQ